MSLLNDVRESMSRPQNNAGTNGGASGSGEERPKSLVWLNIGINLPGAAEDGSDLFVSVGGVALDNVKLREASGNNANMIALTQAKNALVKTLQGAGSKMTPGEARVVQQLSVQMLRVNEPSAVGTAESNPLIAMLNEKLFG